MRNIYLLAIIFLSSCDSKHCVHTDNVHDHKIEYIEKYCPNCNGTGKVKMDAGSRVVLGILTFGCGALCETSTCEMCDGTGVIKVRKLNN